MASIKQRISWAVVATVKETLEATQEFIAHYKALGADEMHVFFDDPDDALFQSASSIDGVHATRCTSEYWQGDRPNRHQKRQKLNAKKAYLASKCDWIVHLDADEFIYCPNGVTKLLAGLPDIENAAQIIPAEPLIHPQNGQIKAYHSPLPNSRIGERIGEAAFGEIYPLLANGMLSHSDGKFFLRTGLPEAPIAIHRPNIPGRTSIPTLSVKDALLLHHHGHDEDNWIKKFHYRINNTYSAMFWDDKANSGRVDGKGLNAYLTDIHAREGDDGLRKFFRKVYHIDRSKAVLRRANAIHRPNVWLAQKRIDLFDEDDRICRDFAVNQESGRLEAKADFLGISMVIEPDFNYTEQMLALGSVDEEEELLCIRDLVKGKTVDFWDIGANTGIYSLLVSSTANNDSRISAFEPHPRMIDAINRNIALNGFKNIHLKPVALGNQNRQIELHVTSNLGQSSLIGDSTETIMVDMAKLADFILENEPNDMSIMKIDVEGAEPIVLEGFFDKIPQSHFPNYILYEHSHEKVWKIPADEVFPQYAYEPAAVFEHNTLLKKVDF